MKGNFLRVSCTTGVVVLCSAIASAQTHPVLDVPGIQDHRDYFSAMPFEHIDTFTGSLVLTFTDLVLPGNGGRELRFQRTFNSKPVPGWSYGIAGIPLRIEDSAEPLAHTPQTPQDLAPVLVMGDGAKRGMAWLESGSYVQAISSDFWLFNRSTRVLSIPNGDTCQYEAVISGTSRVLQCEDAFGNVVSFSWAASAPQLTILQWVGSNSRQIAFTFSATTTMTYAGRTWTYTNTSATPPAGTGPGWSFGYTTEGYLNSVTTPNGGVISYEYGPLPFTLPPDLSYETPAVTKRTTGGRSIEPGVWTYTYSFDIQYADRRSGETTVDVTTDEDEPIRRMVYHHGWSAQETGRPDSETLFGGDAGIAPLRLRTVYAPDGQGGWGELEREARTYRETVLPVLTWTTLGSLGLESVTITRTDEGVETAYSTAFGYSGVDFDDYHQPNTITETGSAGTRVTDRTFKHTTTKYVLALPASETVTLGSDSVTKAWTYDDDDGFRLSETVSGITTEFGAGSFGNVDSVVKANGKFTSYESYRFGQPQTIRTPEYVVTRTINADGRLASETQAGRTSAVTYDALGRSLVTQPPGEATPTFVEYDSGGEWEMTSRGTSFVKTTVDGFGRPIQTENAVGVRTTTAYDLDGRVVREGYPFKPGAISGGVDIWTEVKYDALGRVAKRVNPDGSQSTHEYLTGGVVKITDEEGKETRQTWKAFGNPSGALLSGLRDADGNDWSYEYEVAGRLKKVIAPDGKTRTWTFNQQTQLLDFEQHPESGITAYQYDAAGVLWRTTDANNKVTEYTYDGNDRVKTVNADGRLTTIVYEPGSDNRESATNPSGKVTWRHHLNTGRLQFRQDTIDNKTFTTLFEYDNSDNVTAVVYPSGRRVQYDHNVESQPTRVWEPAAGRNYANGVLYHPSGGVEAYIASNGIATTITYESSRYRIGQITSGPMQFTYADYDNVGNPLAINDSRGAGYSQTLTYDNLYRLNSAAGPYGSLAYTYDAHGNRTGGAFQYELNTLRLSNQNGTAFTYDFAGNTLTAGPNSFSYTPTNKVELVTRSAPSVSYGYDADEQRVKRTSAGSTTYLIRGLSGELLTEWKDPGTSAGRVRDYMYLGSRLLAAVAKNTAEDPPSYSIPLTPSHRWATSWQVPTGNGDNVTLNGGITGSARKTFHPDMPSTGLRLGTQPSNVSLMANGPLFPNSDPTNPKQGGVFIEFEIERRPFSINGEWLGSAGGVHSTDDLRLYITPAGALVVTHDDSRGTPLTLYTSAPIELHTTHTVELRFEYNSYPGPYALPNPAWENLTSHAEIFFDGVQVATYGATPGGSYNNAESSPLGLDTKTGLGAVGPIRLKSPGPTNGLLMNVFRAGLTSAQSHGDALGQYGNTWRTTLLQVAGPGTYSQWTGGQPDWRAHSAVHFQIGSLNTVQSTSPNQKMSYQMESMLSRGITGNIGVVMVGIRNAYATSGSQAFIRRNGIDTMLPGLTLPSNTNSGMRWYRVSEGGWSPTDTIEVGMVSGGATGNTWLTSVAVMVEHNTPEPAPLTDTSARVVTVGYTGNGTGQTIDLGINLVPTALLVVPSSGAQGVEPLIWWDGRQGAQPFADSGSSFGRVWPQQGKLQVVQPTAGNSYNLNGVSYTAIALFDPSGRYVIPFGVSTPAAEDDYTHQLRWPQSGALAATFTPDFVFGGVSSTTNAYATVAAFYKGPGHAGDLTAKLGTTEAADADRIQAMTAGQVQFGKGIGSQFGDTSFWAGRVSDGVATDRLMAVTSYVGDGAASRNIPLELDGQSPVFALVVPTTAVAKVYRVSTDTTGRASSTGNVVANSITAMGSNQITVGTALNATGVTYDVWAIRPGLVAPW